MSEKYKMYNGSVILEFNEKKHYYTANGIPVDGTTSILGIKAKPALMYWAVNQACEYLEKNLEVGKSVDEIEKKTLIEGAKKAHREFKNKSADYGTMLHNIIERHVKKLPYEEPNNEKLRDGLALFKNWMEENKVEVLGSERKVFSKKYSFAGTVDLILKINGKVTVADFKTSSGIYDTYWMQNAAYRLCLLEEFPNHSIEDLAVVRCGRDGSFEAQSLNHNLKGKTSLEEVEQAFVSALKLHRWTKQFNKK